MEKVKAALIGCGGRNGVHFQKLSVMEDVDLIGFCDTDVARAQAMADKYGSGKVYDNYKSMLDDIKPDVIFIAVPPHQHGEIENAIIDKDVIITEGKTLSGAESYPIYIGKGTTV